MIKLNLQYFGGRGSGSGITSSSSSGNGNDGIPYDNGRYMRDIFGPIEGRASLSMSPQKAMEGYFDNPDRYTVWSGYRDVGRARAYNISEVYGANHSLASGNGDKAQADLDIDRIMDHVVAYGANKSVQRGTSGKPIPTDSNGSPLGWPNARKTLSYSSYVSLRNALIDEAVKFSNGNTRARRDYRKYYG